MFYYRRSDVFSIDHPVHVYIFWLWIHVCFAEQSVCEPNRSPPSNKNKQDKFASTHHLRFKNALHAKKKKIFSVSLYTHKNTQKTHIYTHIHTIGCLFGMSSGWLGNNILYLNPHRILFSLFTNSHTSIVKLYDQYLLYLREKSTQNVFQTANGSHPG